MKISIYPIMLVGVFLFSNCQSTKKVSEKASSTSVATETVSIENKKWRLVELNGKPVEGKVNGKTPFIKFDSKENRYSANAGCNMMGGQYTLDSKGKLSFSKGMSTMMACTDMSLEDQFSKAFELVDNFTVNGNNLSLNKGRMAPLARFELVTDKDILANLDGEWELDVITSPENVNMKEAFPEKKPTITFNTAEMRVNGSGSCNRYNSIIKIEGDKLSFGPIGSTRMACPQGGNGEYTYFKALESVNQFEVDDNTLYFNKDGVRVMRLYRK